LRGNLAGGFNAEAFREKFSCACVNRCALDCGAADVDAENIHGREEGRGIKGVRE
jgi:hypothetical protein